MSKQTLRYNRFLLEQPLSVMVDLINRSTFAIYAKAWAHLGFLTILKEIDSTGFQVKLYLDDNKIKNRDTLYIFVTTYYIVKFREFIKHTHCSLILIYAGTWIDVESIVKANSLDDLEQTLLNILPDETPVIHSNQGVNNEQCTIPAFFFTLNGLFLDGYLELDYIEICCLRKTIAQKKYFGSNPLSFVVFMNIGGLKPDSFDLKDINTFFQGNCAKRWAMCDGYQSTFTGYENGKIQFELITDPRCTGLDWHSLCCNISIQYKKYVTLLKDAITFEVKHFVVNDIIGFNLIVDDNEKLKWLNYRVQAAIAGKPKKSAYIHCGKIY